MRGFTEDRTPEMLRRADSDRESREEAADVSGHHGKYTRGDVSE